MNIKSCRALQPSAGIRVLLVGEVAAFTAVVMACVWLGPPEVGGFHWWHIMLWMAAFALPVGANLLHGDRPADSGLRTDNLVPAAREALAATLVLGLIILAVGLMAGGFSDLRWGKSTRLAVTYVAGGLIQQYILQAFALCRLRQAGLGKLPAVVLAASLFAIVHAPNWVLSGLTAGTAVVWCILFLRHRNLLVLAVSHGLLAWLVYHAWPKGWHLGLAIGPNYLSRLARMAP